MAGKTSLQEALPDAMLCRDLQEVMSLFQEGGISLWREVCDGLRMEMANIVRILVDSSNLES